MAKLPETPGNKPLIPDPFLADDVEANQLLAATGVSNVDELFRSIPEPIQQAAAAALQGSGADEWEIEAYFGRLASQNRSWPAGRLWLGAGAYQYPTPSPVHELLGRTEFLTSYTPYQPEISQGTLQGLFEFQTLVANLFGMEIANASLYDGPSAVAEAILMALRLRKKARTVCLSAALSDDVHSVVKTYLAHVDCEIMPSSLDPKTLTVENWPEADIYVAGYPNALGVMEDLAALRSRFPDAFLISYTSDPHALLLYREPGQLGIDVAVGEGQAFGLPVGFGGPYLGLLATHSKNLRQIPGRLCGATKDEDGREGYVLTLSTREQHIRREKATSNICSNQGILTLAFTAYAASFAWKGLRALAQRVFAQRRQVEDWLSQQGYQLAPGIRYNEGLVLGQKALTLHEHLLEEGFRFGVPADQVVRAAPDALLFASPAMTTDNDLAILHEAIITGATK